jgi:hypothetical protein
MRWLKLVVALMAVLGALAGAAYGLSLYYELPAPEPGYAKPRSLAEAQRDDLDYLRKLPWLDWSYTDETRAAANRVIDAALKKPLPLPRGDFELVVARVNALADNGHTNVRGGARANRLNRLPVRFYVFADGVFVVRSLPIERGLLGARLVAVDGRSVEEIAQAVSIYTGGTQEEKNVRLPLYLESPELLHAAGVAQQLNSVTLSFALKDGSRVRRSIAALPPDPKAPILWPSDELKPVPNVGQSADWIPALKGTADHLLMFAGEPDPFYAQALPERRGFYARFDTNNDSGKFLIADFVQRTFEQAVAARPDFVIVDLRMNGGGDYTTTAHFMRTLPEALPHATFYILISQETFSAGMSSAAVLKQAAGTRGHFVGTLPGDRMRFHSEGSDFCLPFSGVCMAIRTGVHDYSERICTPLITCYPLDLLYPVAIRSFQPDMPVPLTYAALSAGRDPAIDAIFAREKH